MSKKNRRRFLEDSMFASVAALAATSVAAPLIADDEVQSKSPNETLNVAVIGVRGRGGSHIEGFVPRSDTVITHLCDPDEKVLHSRADQVAAKQGSRPKVVKDMRQVFDDPSVDVVSIATPNHWHALAAIWAIQAGKDVYVEKPVSHNVSEGRRIVQAARKHQKICQTGTQCRSNPSNIESIAFLRGGGIGDIRVARGLCYKRRGSIGARGDYPIPAEIDYDLWSGPAEIAPLTRPQLHYDWHWQWAYGNGDLGNQGIHQMDLARWGLGVEHVSPRLFSYGGRFGYEDAGDTANTQVVVHDYGPKSLVFEVRGLKTDSLRGAQVGVIFEGTQGYLVMTSYDQAAAFDPDGNLIKSFKGGSDALHYANFVKAVRSRNHADLSADILEGHLSSALCHTGNISYRLGEELSLPQVKERLQGVKCTDNLQATLERTLFHLAENGVEMTANHFRVGPVLTMNPETETFVGNDQANQMLTREYRKPFVVPDAGLV